jgi:hypothetical protein
MQIVNNIVNNITTNNIILIILSLMLIIYAYTDYIKPIIINLMNGKSIQTTITETFLSQESFTSQYSSLTPGMSNSVDFDTNSYLRENNKPIIINNKISLPVIKYCYFSNGSYENLVGNYFRKHIYPVSQIQSISNIDAIYKFINNEIDIAFINEEVLSRYIKKDCRYMTRLLAQSFNISLDQLDSKDSSNEEKENEKENENILEKIYPPINISAIGVGFHIDFYLIVSNFSNILEFSDIQYVTNNNTNNKKVGILADSYYYYIKLCMAYGIDITSNIYSTSHIVEPNLETLINIFRQNKYDAIFVALHPKNIQLLNLSKNMLLRYVHIQKKDTLDARNNLSNLSNLSAQQGTNSENNILPPPTLNNQAIYSQTLLNDLKTVNIRENFNSIIKKYFKNILPRAVDLNKFYKSENKYSYLDTYSTRMILVIRNDIPKEKVEYITRNYINNLEKLRNSIDMDNFDTKINNFSSLEFDYQELVSFDNDIPISEGARNVYKKEGLIYFEEDMKSRSRI